MSEPVRTAPPDQEQREQALDPRKSILVQAPAGSGKTDLLTRRFLRLLSEVDDPEEIVAITFTKAAAAEMRHRIALELEKASTDLQPTADEFSMEWIASKALARSQAAGWNLVDLPKQLRISTIDSFCRDLALQQPMLTGLGGGLDIAEQPHQHYRKAACRTLEKIGAADSSPGSRLQQSIETLLLWRDNNWGDLENQLVDMLEKRDRWMQDFVLESEQDWDALRARLERPFARAVSDALNDIAVMLDQRPGAREETLALARFACGQSPDRRHRELAELTEFPCVPFTTSGQLEEARAAYDCLAGFLLTGSGTFRKTVNITNGFPPDFKREKERLVQLNRSLSGIEGLEAALAAVIGLPPVRYAEEDWTVVRACFTLLRHAAAELKVVFAEAGTVDYVEVAQAAQHVLEGPDGNPTDTALAISSKIRHLLVDEFQDTSRKQHKLISSLVAAWPDTLGRSIFVVGDPLQSIYFFRDADTELFSRVRHFGLDIPSGEPLRFHFAPLASNFRTLPRLVQKLNEVFEGVFRLDDGSGLSFSPSKPMRSVRSSERNSFALHLEFVPQRPRGRMSDAASLSDREAAARDRELAAISQTSEIVALISSHLERMDDARRNGKKYRIAVLGRTRTALAPIAQALRDASIPFSAVDLERLGARPEVLDLLALARALFNSEDRVAWLGVLRAPWCGLSLEELYTLTSADDPQLLETPISDLLIQRAHLLSAEGQGAVVRFTSAVDRARAMRSMAPNECLGTWLQQLWQRLGGEHCVSPTALSNLNLLWKCLDSLPGGEPDLLGDALPSALGGLTAQPDPEVTSDCGVQLMTIHKSKGLEFEIVIVPELQVATRRTTGDMLSWLERGLGTPDDSGAITEFMIAPIPRKGEEHGSAKRWVDRVRHDRECQEIRRILYVASTRAREELHFFARMDFKPGQSGEQTLCEPSRSLLSAAWPAFAEEARARFENWKRNSRDALSLAAQGDSNLIEMPLRSASTAKPAIIRRLPAGFDPTLRTGITARTNLELVRSGANALYERHRGGAVSRSLGSAVHAFFEGLARFLSTLNPDEARSAVAASRTRIIATIRSVGIPPDEAGRIADEAMELTLRASFDPVAAWILAPHADAGSEARWSGMIDGTVCTVQVDRSFRAGDQPLSDGNDVLWIVDYKTAHDESDDPDRVLQELRPLFAPQLEVYARMLREIYGSDIRICCGLYYPRMLRFDWWQS